MLFTVMDKGTYRPLGAVNDRRAQLMIIGATTEYKDADILETFKRRMPIVIKLPKLNERPYRERLDLVILFFSKESEKLGLAVSMDRKVLKYLIAFESDTNIGALKNEIQICCAKAYLRYIENLEIQENNISCIHVVKQDLSRGIIEEKSKEQSADSFLEEVVPENAGVVITKSGMEVVDKKEEFVKYKQESRTESKSKEEGLSGYGKVAPSSVRMARQIYEQARLELASSLPEKTLEAIAYWVEQVQSYARQGNVAEGQILFDDDIWESTEGKFVKSMLPRIEKEQGFKLAESEAGLLILLLREYSGEHYEENTGEGAFGLILASEHVEKEIQTAKLINGIFRSRIVYTAKLEPEKEDVSHLTETMKKLREKKGVIILTDYRELLKKRRFLQKETGLKCNIIVKSDLDMKLITEIAKSILVASEDQDIEMISGIVKRKDSIERIMEIIKGK